MQLLMKLQKGAAKAEIERANEILEKHLGNTNDICKLVDAIYDMSQTVKERKGLKWNQKRKEKKTHEGPTRRIQKIEKKIKELKVKIKRKKEED